MSLVDPKRLTQGDKDISELIKKKNPPTNKKNTKDDTRNIVEKSLQDGPGAGGKPDGKGGVVPVGGGGGTGDSAM